MNIISALTKVDNIRLSFGDRWLYFDRVTEKWVVREHQYTGYIPYRQRGTTILCETMDQDEAVQVLLSGSTE